jgi:prevent-host-death family protein
MECRQMEIGAFEAKNKLSQLLDMVERGQEITITRHGKGVARLVPTAQLRGCDEARSAMRRMRERAKAQGAKFKWSEWKKWRDTGRP